MLNSGTVDHTFSFMDNHVNKKQYSDIIFMVQGKQFYAHRVVLAGVDSYFKRLLFSNMKEANESVFELEEVTHRILVSIMKFIYTAKMKIDAKIAIKQMYFASQYNLPQMVETISLCMQDEITTLNLIEVMKIAQETNAIYLKFVCCKFLLQKMNSKKSLQDFGIKFVCEELLKPLVKFDNIPTEQT